jgi:hypothetical protein
VCVPNPVRFRDPPATRLFLFASAAEISCDNFGVQILGIDRLLDPGSEMMDCVPTPRLTVAPGLDHNADASKPVAVLERGKLSRPDEVRASRIVRRGRGPVDWPQLRRVGLR